MKTLLANDVRKFLGSKLACIGFQSLFVIFVVLLIGCKTTPDPIDHLVTDFSSSYGLWENGAFPILGLPQTASSEQVIQKTFEMTGFDRGHVTNYKILTMRQVHIPGSLPDLYTAALVQTDLSEKILLFKYAGTKAGWWSRVYEANRSYYGK